ncbi:MAG: class II aldolase/adducin family protein [Bdellovibrionales bacterium]
MNPSDVKAAMVASCRRLYDRNCLAAADGNISVRLSDEQILITPSGVAKAFMNPGQMAVMTLSGQVLQGEPSGERQMHLAVYRNCPNARAVVHAHPPHAIAWSVIEPRHSELPNDILSEVVLAAGRIPIVPYARPTTVDMGTQLEPFLPNHRLMILERHGALAWGESLEEATNGLERLEHSAQILWLASCLGPMRPLPAAEFEGLQKMRAKIGERLL